MADKDVLGKIRRAMERRQITESEDHGSSSLLVEFAPANVQREGRKLFIEGVYLSSKPNKNGRVYSNKVLSIATGHIKDKVASGQMFSTLGHGDSPTVDPTKIAGVVKSLTRKSNGDYYGRSQILDQGAGLVTRALIDAGGKIGVSSRGTGSTRRNKQTGLQEVCEDYRIHSLDLVCEPSTGQLVAAIYESVASETLSSQKLSCDDLAHKVIDILSKLGHPEIVAAQKAHAIDPNKIMPYFDPNNPDTWLAIAEKDRHKIIAQLIDIQQKIALQNDQGALKDKFAAYADLIQRTSDPIKRTAMRREAKEFYYSNRLISETIWLLSRGSRLNEDVQTNSEIARIRRNAGTKISDGSREVEGISNWHREQEKIKHRRRR